MAQETLTKQKKDNYTLFDTPIKKALAIGLHAPTAHNAQAWKFKVINENEALLYVDEKQRMKVTDPLARLAHICCGCFLEAVSIGSTGLGYSAAISLFPEGDYSLDDVGKKPVALIKLGKDEKISKSPLWDFIFERRMSRGDYYGDVITTEEFNTALSDCSIDNSKIVFINDPAEMARYGEIFKKAMEIEFNTLAANEEVRKIFRFSDREAVEKRDGITYDGMGVTGINKFFARMFTRNTQESWNSKSTISASFNSFVKHVNSARGFFCFITEKNGFTDQVKVGRDVYRFLLVMLINGFYVHPLNQANEEYPEMDEQRTILNGYLGTNDIKKVQFIGRIGRSNKPFESYRRHLNDFIER